MCAIHLYSFSSAADNSSCYAPIYDVVDFSDASIMLTFSFFSLSLHIDVL